MQIEWIVASKFDVTKLAESPMPSQKGMGNLQKIPPPVILYQCPSWTIKSARHPGQRSWEVEEHHKTHQVGVLSNQTECFPAYGR